MTSSPPPTGPLATALGRAFFKYVAALAVIGGIVGYALGGIAGMVLGLRLVFGLSALGAGLRLLMRVPPLFALPNSGAKFVAIAVMLCSTGGIALIGALMLAQAAGLRH